MQVFHDGDRVHHTGWDATGTVHVFADAGPDEAQAEVQWDGTCVADELDRVADQLQRL